MKVFLLVAGALVLLVAGMAAIGSLLPKRHVVTRSAVFGESPERLFELIVGKQDWRPDVRESQLVTEHDGRHFQLETLKRGVSILYEVQGARPPEVVQRRIATGSLPYGGTWTFVLEPVVGGTEVRITEDGEVYNPLFRFVSRFVIGPKATLDAYLIAMGKAVGEEAYPAD
jgi:hypothetical protein